jgi:hypothetical protein
VRWNHGVTRDRHITGSRIVTGHEVKEQMKHKVIISEQVSNFNRDEGKRKHSVTRCRIETGKSNKELWSNKEP